MSVIFLKNTSKWRICNVFLAVFKQFRIPFVDILYSKERNCKYRVRKVSTTKKRMKDECTSSVNICVSPVLLSQIQKGLHNKLRCISLNASLNIVCTN